MACLSGWASDQWSSDRCKCADGATAVSGLISLQNSQNVSVRLNLLLDCVRDELRGLALMGKGRIICAVCAHATERCTLNETGLFRGSVDEDILYYASTHGCIVFTNDRDLRTTLLAQGIPVISLAGKQRLEVYRN